MHPSEAAYVLAVCATYDQRTPSQAEAQTWGLDLGNITKEEAVEAVREHHRTTETPHKRIQIAHIIAIVKRQRRDRVAHSAALEAQMLADVDPDDPRAVRDAIRQARQVSGQSGAPIPTRLAITGPHEESEDRDARILRGVAMAKAVLAAKRPQREPGAERATDVTPAVLAARLRARTEHRRHRGDPDPISGVLHRINQRRNRGTR